MFRFNQLRSNEPSSQSGDSEKTDSSKPSPLSSMGSKPQGSSLNAGASSPFSAQGTAKSGSPFSSSIGGGGSVLNKKTDSSSSTINTGIPKVPQPTGNTPVPPAQETPAATPTTPAPTPFASSPTSAFTTPPSVPKVTEEKPADLPSALEEIEESTDNVPSSTVSESLPITKPAVEAPAYSAPKGLAFSGIKSFAPPSTSKPEFEKPVVSEFIEEKPLDVAPLPPPVVKAPEAKPVINEVASEPEPLPVTPPPPKVAASAPPAAGSTKLNFSLPIMGGQDQIDHIRLEIYHDIIRACGTLKKISRAEATSLINITSKAPEGLILPHVSKMISIPPDALQADLLAKDSLSFAPINFFANVLKTSKFEKSRRLLAPYGIIPLFSKDAIITCGMELPHLRDVVLEVSNRHSLGFKWCHAIIFKIKDLQDAITTG